MPDRPGDPLAAPECHVCPNAQVSNRSGSAGRFGMRSACRPEVVRAPWGVEYDHPQPEQRFAQAYAARVAARLVGLRPFPPRFRSLDMTREPTGQRECAHLIRQSLGAVKGTLPRGSSRQTTDAFTQPFHVCPGTPSHHPVVSPPIRNPPSPPPCTASMNRGGRPSHPGPQRHQNKPKSSPDRELPFFIFLHYL